MSARGPVHVLGTDYAPSVSGSVAPTTVCANHAHVNFDYRHWTSEGSGNGMQVSFRLKDSVGTLYPATVYPLSSPGTPCRGPAIRGRRWVATPDVPPPTGTTGYQTGTVTFTIGGKWHGQ